MSPLVVLVLGDCMLIGLGLAYLPRLPLRLEERLAVAGPLGALALSLAGWALAVPLGFDLTTLGLAVALANACSLPGWRRGAATLREDARAMAARVQLAWRNPDSLRPLLALLAVAWPLIARIFSLAWVTTADGGLAAGHLATWGDGAAHLAYAGAFATGGEVPAGSPIAAGEPLRYHVLVDLFAAQASLLGVPLPSALAVTSGFLALSFPAVAYLAGVRLTGSRHAALVGVVVFCAGGGLGFVHLLDDIRGSGIDVLWDLPRPYARDPDADLWMDNPSLAYLHAQRNGLLGLPLALAALTLVWSAQQARRTDGLVAAGVLVGALPLANGFAFLIAMAIIGAWALLDRTHAWWRFFVPALVLGLPVAWWLQPPESSVRWLPGWMADGGVGDWLWFWFRNAGPFIVLLVVACAWRGTVRPGLVKAFLPVWLLWVVPNLVAFHPWEWNNTKYFAFWQLLGAFLVGAVVVRVGRAGRLGAACAALALGALCLSGGLDLLRATDRETSAIPWTTADGLAVAHWVRDELPPDAVIAVAPTNIHPVTALSGHAVVSGYPGWTYDLAIPDWRRRVDDEIAILRGGPAALQAAERRAVDYVVIGPLERAPDIAADDRWWSRHTTTVFRSGDWTVYSVESWAVAPRRRRGRSLGGLGATGPPGRLARPPG
jgi:hypothetical protein